MGKLKVFSASELVKLLAAHGFEKIRQKGSHIVMQKKHNNTTKTVIIPDHKEIKTGTLQSVIRQSGLEKDIFEEKN